MMCHDRPVSPQPTTVNEYAATKPEVLQPHFHYYNSYCMGGRSTVIDGESTTAIADCTLGRGRTTIQH